MLGFARTTLPNNTQLSHKSIYAMQMASCRSNSGCRRGSLRCCAQLWTIGSLAPRWRYHRWLVALKWLASQFLGIDIYLDQDILEWHSNLLEWTILGWHSNLLRISHFGMAFQFTRISHFGMAFQFTRIIHVGMPFQYSWGNILEILRKC